MNAQTTIGKYTIVRKLGEGGMGEVYEARHTGTGRRVAVKVITSLHSRNESLLARFELEARAAGTIESEHIVSVLDVGRDEATGAPFLVMEYLVGEDVQHLCERIGPAAPDLTLRVGVQALLGLAKAHAQGIVHRDIKPANLFLTERDGGEMCVKVLDFGIAKVNTGELESGEKKRPITRTGSFVGSPLYMSPEQTRGKGMVDHRSDLWSLGIVLYQMLAGRTPFDHIESLGDFIVAVRSTPVDPVRLHAPWVDPVIARAIERALVIDQAGRYQSADEMRAALAAFLPQGASITAAMLVPTRPQEGPVTATVMGAGTAMAATTPGTPYGVPTPPPHPPGGAAILGPAVAAQSNPASYMAALAAQGTPALPSRSTPTPSAPALAAHGTIALAGAATPAVVGTGSQAGPQVSQTPAQPGTGGKTGLLIGGALLAAIVAGLFVARALLHKGAPTGHGGTPTAATSTPQHPAPSPAPGPDAGTLAPELAALVGTWHGDNGVVYDAKPTGDALRFHIHDATSLAAQGYEDGEVQFSLLPHTGAAGTFRVEARIRPQPPAGTTYDSMHSRATCFWSDEAETLRAELEGDRLQVDLVRLDPPGSAFNREVGGTRIMSCSGLAQAPHTPVELWLSRGGAPHDAGAPRSATLGGFWATCSADTQCASHNCYRGTCRRNTPEAHCHTGANCTSGRCMAGRCQ